MPGVKDIPVPLGPSTFRGKSKQAGVAQLVNCFVEETHGAKAKYAIYTDPGLSLFATLSAGEKGRGWVNIGNTLYAIVGEKLYSVSSGGVATYIGVILGSAPVVISVNRKSPNPQITITTESTNYLLEAGVLSTITDPDLPSGVHSNCYLNGRTVYGINDGRFFISGDNDSGTINALDFAEAERSSDAGVRVYTNGEELWYFGALSLEIFRDTGATFPFEPLLGAGSGEGSGCSAKNSVALVGGAMTWINDKKTVVQAVGYQPTRISNSDVDRDIDRAVSAGLGNEIIGFSWSENGHEFYHISCSLWCWVRDSLTREWHRKEGYLGDRWRGMFYISAFSKDLILSTTGKIFEYTFTAKTEDGDPLVTEIVSSCMHDFPNGVICHRLALDMQMGVGIATGADYIANPQVSLRMSYDGGETFGREYLQSMGAQGKWNTQVWFNRLGQVLGQAMVFKIRMSAPVERALFNGVASVSGLRA